jgi:presenilin-like A22 family membrane protease
VTQTKRKLSDFSPLLSMLAIYLVVQVVSVFLSKPILNSGTQVFSDPNQVSNSFSYVGYVLIGTLGLLIAMKLGFNLLIRVVISFSIVFSFFFVFTATLSYVPFLSENMCNVIGSILAIALALVLYKYPEWYVVNTAGILASIAFSVLLGVSFNIVPAIVLLIILAVYDAISVYKTKHMVTLAKNAMALKLPLMFVIPKNKNYSFLAEPEKPSGITEQVEPSIGEEELQPITQEKHVFFLGLGDVAEPTLLVVSANVFVQNIYPVVGAMIGTLVGCTALYFVAMKGKPQAGLPFLNTGVILGFFVGLLLGGVWF